MPETVPSFFFYHVMRQVVNLPSEFWPYLADTKVHTVCFSHSRFFNYTYGKKIDAKQGLIQFAEALQDSKVHTVNISCTFNGIGDAAAVEFTKNLQSTNVKTIKMEGCNISGVGAAALATSLQGTSVHTLCLGNNRLGGSEVAEFAKNLQGTSVHTISLSKNQIGPQEVAALAKGLQGTQVHTIYLNHNDINDVGAAEFARNLEGTRIRNVFFRNIKIENRLKLQKIGNIGAVEFARNLTYSSLNMVDLRENDIEDEGVLNFARILQSQYITIDTIYLRGNKIGGETKKLLKEYYTDTKWKF
jgi:hypothetical protein